MKISRSFAWLNVTQFLGALNDNVFRLLVVFFLVEGLQQDATRVLAAAMTVFVTPFILFSHAAGVLADRVSKRAIIVVSKWIELFVMALGCVAICFGLSGVLYALIFLMATQSAMFGPSKYGIIPELVDRDSLSKANGFLVGLSYLAIILGTFIPSFGLDVVLGKSYAGLSVLCVVLAVAGVAAGVKIEKTPAAGTGKRFSPLFLREIYRTLRGISSDRQLFLAVTGVGYFLFLAAFINQNLIIYGKEYLQLGWIKSGYLFPAAALGIGVGALLSGKVSGRNIEFGIVPVGALGLTLCTLALGFLPLTITTVIILMFFTGVSAGLYIVPLNAFIQFRSPLKQRGEILACTNFLSFLGAALSAMAMLLFHKVLRFETSECFIVIGALTGVLATAAILVLPDFFIRFVLVTFAKSMYRITLSGVENVPVEGPALLVSNHVSWADPLLIGATQQRRIRFLTGRAVYDRKALKPILRLMKSIPISPRDPPREIVAALREARASLDEGNLVCIFAEGAMTRNGNLRAFRPGLERIIRGSNHPVIPVHIGGGWGSIFSYYRGRLLSSLPRQVRYPVHMSFGEPLPASSSVGEIRQAVLELSADQFDSRKGPGRSLPFMFVRCARKRWRRQVFADSTGKTLTFGRALVSAIALGSELDRASPGQEKVGVVLPATVAASVTNLALTLLGKVPVNLNFTASGESIASAVRQCDIKTVISSRAFLEKLEGFTAPDGTVFLEDLAKGITTSRKVGALLKALFVPPRLLASFRKPGPDDVATVIFSSGSTGEPKGIVLTHHNIISNVEAFMMVLRLEQGDHMCAVLPLFHSFGFTCTLWCPVLRGFDVFFHPNPLDTAKIPELIRENGLTVLLATPTFLLGYMRRAAREDLASLRYVIVGAEKLKTTLADAFEKKFGLRPLEGYGATELSPVAALNVPDAEIDGVFQVGTKAGSVGHPIPGMTMRIVDPDTLAPLPEGEEGLVLARGPNVMREYLDSPEKTAESSRDGWYDTGDVGRIDADGFVFLVDRVSRFSKIGGEMVPHVAVEEKLVEGLKTLQRVVAVAGAPDEKRGEQLVVFYTEEAGTPEDLQRIIDDSGLPNLWKPRKDNYMKIDELPILGSGKLDIKRLKQMARDLVAQ